MTTMDALARRLEVSHQAVGKWLRHSTWPAGRQPPWTEEDVPKILEWRATLMARTAASGSKLREEKIRQEIRKLRAQATTAELALNVERGKLLHADQVREQWLNVSRIVRNAIMGLTSSIVPLALRRQMPTTEVAEFQLELQALIETALQHLSHGSGAD